ncbi:MAG: hypothetical protein EU550_00225 [Promethearchaeota archaeon]|nr:MAG: hypothetical protein EU550_00225 [Candidatus Lokiarchaeota archaeon]
MFPLVPFILGIVFFIISIRSIQILKSERAIISGLIGTILSFFSLIFLGHYNNIEYLEFRFIPVFLEIIIFILLLHTLLVFYLFKIKEEHLKKYSDIKMSLKGWKEFFRRKELRSEKREIVKANLPYINKLIKKDNISTALKELDTLNFIIEKFNLKDLSKKIEDLINFCEILEIKDFLLDKGTNYNIIKIGDIMEKTRVNEKELIVSTINSMIENEEIYAEYFKSTETLKFDKNTNIKEIDKLMEVYKKWETEGIGKRERR